MGGGVTVVEVAGGEFEEAEDRPAHLFEGVKGEWVGWVGLGMV